ncbi:GFA family protein [Pseudomonadota bacterium]|jgi:hypothetical protein|nr:hypothetical protein [Xanthomonadales bacterium]
MFTASCHCKAVHIEIPELSATVTECNCSICRRYGALWAYYTRDQLRLPTDSAALSAYSWGDRTIEFWHCRHCGCLTHYESVDKHARGRVAVNARMLPLEVMESLPVRHFDGAVSWKYLD